MLDSAQASQYLARRWEEDRPWRATFLLDIDSAMPKPVDSCFLVRPTEKYKASFLAGVREFAAEERLDSTYAVCLGYDHDGLEKYFDAFVRNLLAMGAEHNRPNNWYADYILWLVQEDEYLGQLSIRPDLCTAYLITYGGHIGYSIRPSKRQQGLGKKILQLGLQESRRLGLKKILVTCDSDNLASKKIIEHNGGRFERSMKMDAKSFKSEGRKPRDEIAKLRYWIDLAQVSAAA
jgi:predicted acetyltransferase